VKGRKSRPGQTVQKLLNRNLRGEREAFLPIFAQTHRGRLTRGYKRAFRHPRKKASLDHLLG